MKYIFEKLEEIALKTLNSKFSENEISENSKLFSLPGIGFSEWLKMVSTLSAKYHKHKFSFNVEGENLVVYGAKKEQPIVYAFQIIKCLKENNLDDIRRLLNKDNDPSFLLVENGETKVFDVVGYDVFQNKKASRIEVHLKENKEKNTPLYILSINYNGEMSVTLKSGCWSYRTVIDTTQNEEEFVKNFS